MNNSDINILKLVLTTPHALTPVVVGPPGIGKSQRIRKMADDLGWPCEVLSPGERGEGAFGVVPVPDGDYLRYPAPEWVRRFADSGSGIIFVDEINTAPPALQPALLGLILDGRIGGYQLPAGVRRVAAMNPVSQAASGWDLPSALANRMQYLVWDSPSGHEWTDWLLGEAVGEESSGWTRARSLVAAYHRKNPGRLMEDPDKALSGRFPPAFASPRSWETAVRMLARCVDESGKDFMSVYPMLAEGSIGKPQAAEWCAWLRKNDLPDPEDLLADPDSWKPDKKESDKVFATCFAVAEAAIRARDDLGREYGADQLAERWGRAWKALARAMPLGKGLVAIAATRLCKPGHARPEVLRADKSVRDYVMSMQEVTNIAGL